MVGIVTGVAVAEGEGVGGAEEVGVGAGVAVPAAAGWVGTGVESLGSNRVTCAVFDALEMDI